MTVIINGRSYAGGNNISITGNRVVIDGKDVTPEDAKVIDIRVNGSVETLSVDAAQSVTIGGNAGSVKTLSGDVSVVGDVTGPVQTMSGDVKARSITGPTSTMSGDISI